jgi:hypothetical protein
MDGAQCAQYTLPLKNGLASLRHWRLLVELFSYVKNPYGIWKPTLTFLTFSRLVRYPPIDLTVGPCGY